MSSLNLIIKDFLNNDNLIYINSNYKFCCSCGTEYCHHLDYVIHCITQSLNNKPIDNNYFKIIGFNNIESLKLSICYDKNLYHDIEIKFYDNKFHFNCLCRDTNYFNLKYSVINFISNYLKNKEKVTNNFKKDSINELDISKLII